MKIFLHINRRFSSLIAFLLAAILLLSVISLSINPAIVESAEPKNPYIVVLKEGVDPRGLAKRFEVTPEYVYTAAFGGFSALLTDKQVQLLNNNPAVNNVLPDGTDFKTAGTFSPLSRTDNSTGNENCIFSECQHIPVQMQRVEATKSKTADIDWKDDARVNADIAVIDTGVHPHSEINLTGTKFCGQGQNLGVPDNHGTFVAGVAGMIDDTDGLVGSAPGARIWSVQVTDTLAITDSSVLCAVDWVVANSDLIEVANISLVNNKSEIGNCGVTDRGRIADPLHYSVCQAVDRGVTFAVAAGNESDDAGNYIPASYDEVITVSAYADYDGEPGGRSEPVCYGRLFDDEDDSFADFSNFGPDVDLTAPGECVLSAVYVNGMDRYGFSSGTSYSSPAIAGAAALILANEPDTAPEQVRAALIENGENVVMTDDPDGVNEQLLNLKGL